MKPRMRHDETRLVDHFVAVQNQIEIEGSRRTRIRSRPAKITFDGKKPIEELTCPEIDIAYYRAIEDRRLPFFADVIGLVKRRDPHVLYERGQRGNGPEQVGLPIAYVAAERDRDWKRHQV